MLVIPSQRPGVGEAFGLTRWQLDRVAWAIEPDGRVYAGAAAINRILLLIGFPWSGLAQLFRVPLARWLEERVYDWVAAHRAGLSRFWSTRPACDVETCE